MMSTKSPGTNILDHFESEMSFALFLCWMGRVAMVVGVLSSMGLCATQICDDACLLGVGLVWPTLDNTLLVGMGLVWPTLCDMLNLLIFLILRPLDCRLLMDCASLSVCWESVILSSSSLFRACIHSIKL